MDPQLLTVTPLRLPSVRRLLLPKDLMQGLATAEAVNPVCDKSWFLEYEVESVLLAYFLVGHAIQSAFD